jgi:hypothetical protein
MGRKGGENDERRNETPYETIELVLSRLTVPPDNDALALGADLNEGGKGRASASALDEKSGVKPLST